MEAINVKYFVVESTATGSCRQGGHSSPLGSSSGKRSSFVSTGRSSTRAMAPTAAPPSDISPARLASIGLYGVLAPRCASAIARSASGSRSARVRARSSGCFHERRATRHAGRRSSWRCQRWRRRIPARKAAGIDRWWQSRRMTRPNKRHSLNRVTRVELVAERHVPRLDAPDPAVVRQPAGQGACSDSPSDRSR